jgi:hypothetical protein
VKDRQPSPPYCTGASLVAVFLADQLPASDLNWTTAVDLRRQMISVATINPSAVPIALPHLSDLVEADDRLLVRRV